jgi:hypothetical protein
LPLAEPADAVIDFDRHQGEHFVLKDDAVDVMQIRVVRARVDDTSSLQRAPIQHLEAPDADESEAPRW